MEHLANVDRLDAETLAAYLDGLLANDAVCRADRHIDQCGSCRGELSALAATHSFPTGSGGSFVVIDGGAAGLIEGRLGRYEVLPRARSRQHGRAYDPEL